MNDKLKWAEALVEAKLSEFGLTSYKFEWTNSYKNLGLCNWLSQTIYLSKHFVQHNPTYLIHDVVLHEIAHALTPGHGHDTVWKAKCREIGAKPERLCSGSVMPSKWIAKCCLGEYKANRLTARLRNGACACCRKKLKWAKNLF